MKSIRTSVFAVIAMSSLLILCGCVTAGTQASVSSGQNSPSIDQVQSEAYNGPKARIAVAQFKDKTGAGQRWWNTKIGDGMADQLTTALFNSNRYIVLERQTLGNVLQEQDLGASGRIRQDTAAPIGQIEGAELLVVGAVTEFEGNASGAKGGVGGFGSGVLGAIAGGFKKSHMAIDVRLIDTRTSRIVAATSVEGSATDVNLGGLIGGYSGGSGLAAGLGGWKNTPVEKSLRICIQKAVEFVVSRTPTTYMRHGGGSSSRSGGSGASGLSRSVVRQMQSMLSSLGYDVGTPDGIAGSKTKTAVKEFQQSQGLSVTGEFSPATMKKIREVSGQ